MAAARGDKDIYYLERQSYARNTEFPIKFLMFRVLEKGKLVVFPFELDYQTENLKKNWVSVVRFCIRQVLRESNEMLVLKSVEFLVFMSIFCCTIEQKKDF